MTRRASSNPDVPVITGLGVICIATLFLQATIRSFAKISSSSFSTGTISFFNSDSNNIHTLQSTLARLSILVQELQETLSTIPLDCNPSTQNENFIPRMSPDDQGLFILAGMIIFFTWLIGIGLFMSALHTISPDYMKRVICCGVVGANLALGCIALWLDALPPWYVCVLYVWCSSYAGLIGGTFLARRRDEEGENRKVLEIKAVDSNKENEI